ncbi:MAG: hypothetical protein O3C63_05380 [Cyanobacteria bacterium]|nr:hypothetical protein [Cyanobacteriota bacterium]MDA1019925.1 hypothetical protein [Cyanobacteriota bacterium]
MLTNTNSVAQEASYLSWSVQAEYNKRAMDQLAASNFQDIFSLTKRISEVEVKMNKLKFRTQGIGGMLGIAAGSLGGPLGSVIGFGIGRSVGSFVGNGMAKKYYGTEQAVINEHLYLAKQRDGLIKYNIGIYDGAKSMIRTMRQNVINDDKKILQDMMVL